MMMMMMISSYYLTHLLMRSKLDHLTTCHAQNSL